MRRVLVARVRLWLDLLIGVVGLRGWYTRPCPACGQRILNRGLKRRYCGVWRGW
jgi:hypothetical protein